jgi:hypothetical protein
LLLSVVHALVLSGLGLQEVLRLLAEGDLLLLLCQVTRLAAACAHAVTAAVTLEVVFRADVTTVDHGQDERNSETSETAESHALRDLLVKELVDGKWGGRTDLLQHE